MKYLLLVYTAEQAWTDAERQDCYEKSTRLCHELKRNGQYLAANPLESVSSAASVRVRNGKTVVTDGPFAETREQLGGYFLVEAASGEEAIAIAEKIPGACKGTVEVRPVLEIPGLPDNESGGSAKRLEPVNA
jgi:hypothetical protein